MKVPENYGTLERPPSQQGADRSYPGAGVNDEARQFPVMGESQARRVPAVAREVAPRCRGRPSGPQDVDPHRAILTGTATPLRQAARAMLLRAQRFQRACGAPLWHQDDLAVRMARTQRLVSLGRLSEGVSGCDEDPDLAFAHQPEELQAGGRTSLWAGVGDDLNA